MRCIPVLWDNHFEDINLIKMWQLLKKRFWKDRQYNQTILYQPCVRIIASCSIRYSNCFGSDCKKSGRILSLLFSNIATTSLFIVNHMPKHVCMGPALPATLLNKNHYGRKKLNTKEVRATGSKKY